MSRLPKNPLKRLLPRGINYKEVLFVCIGTDRSTGDCLGPIVGTELARRGYNVVGTLDDPTHALNLEERITKIPEGTFVVAIDACLGKATSVGDVRVEKGPLKPGAGVNKELPLIGDIKIYGIVNVGGFLEYFVLQNTRLSLVMSMANEIVEIITKGLPRTNSNKSKIVVTSMSNRVYKKDLDAVAATKFEGGD